jgi:hypothetical protein
MALHFQFNPAKEGWNSRPALVLTVSLQGDRKASGGNRLDVDRDQAKGTLVWADHSHTRKSSDGFRTPLTQSLH